MVNIQLAVFFSVFSCTAQLVTCCAEEPSLEHTDARSIGIPKLSGYAMVLSAPDRVAAEKYYRPFLVLSEADTIEGVEKQIRNASPLTSETYEVQIPKWPTDVHFCEELKGARQAQKAIAAGQIEGIEKLLRDGPDPKRSAAETALNINISIYGTSESPLMNVTLSDRRRVPMETCTMSFSGKERRLGSYSVKKGTVRTVNLDFYENGVPFVLHSGNSDGLIGWQIRWLPNGEVARAINLHKVWIPPGTLDQ